MISMVPSMKPTQVRGLNVSSTVFDFYVVIDEIVCMKLSSLGSYLSASIILTWVSLSSSLSRITYIGYSIIEFDILLSFLLLYLLILESLIFNDSSYIYCYWRLMMLTISRMLFFLPPRPLNVWDQILFESIVSRQSFMLNLFPICPVLRNFIDTSFRSN